MTTRRMVRAREGPAFRLRRQKVLRVGVPGTREHVLHGAGLDDPAFGHDAHPVRDLTHDREIMGDQQHGHAEAWVLQQLQDLRLDGDIERGGRFVGNQQVGLVGERHGDHHALALAGQLDGVGAQALFGPCRRTRCSSSRVRARASDLLMPRCTSRSR